jgi:hypothetical protein
MCLHKVGAMTGIRIGVHLFLYIDNCATTQGHGKSLTPVSSTFQRFEKKLFLFETVKIAKMCNQEFCCTTGVNVII